MRRFIFVSILLSLVGVWIHPLLKGAIGIPHPQPAKTTPKRPAIDFDLTKGTAGFWRLGKTADGVWWFLSPDNAPEFLNTVTTVQPFQLPRDTDGPHFVSRDWNGAESNQGDFEAWAQKTIARVRGVGFKGLGAWCNPIFHKYNIPITRDLNIWSWMKPESRRFYSPEWATVAEQAVKTQAAPLRENRSLVGYFIDNELDWGEGGSGPGTYFDYLAPADPNRREVVGVLRTIWPTIDKFNLDWGKSLKDWPELDSWQALPTDHPQAHGQLFSAWLSHLATDYFRTTSTLIRKYDPNHLILGVRFKG